MSRPSESLGNGERDVLVEQDTAGHSISYRDSNSLRWYWISLLVSLLDLLELFFDLIHVLAGVVESFQDLLSG